MFIILKVANQPLFSYTTMEARIKYPVIVKDYKYQFWSIELFVLYVSIQSKFQSSCWLASFINLKVLSYYFRRHRSKLQISLLILFLLFILDLIFFHRAWSCSIFSFSPFIIKHQNLAKASSLVIKTLLQMSCKTWDREKKPKD